MFTASNSRERKRSEIPPLRSALGRNDNPSLRVIPRRRSRRGISQCAENTQSEIPRSARNDTCVLGGFLDLFTASNSRERKQSEIPPLRSALGRNDNPSLRVIPRRRSRRGISQCVENTQSEIPRSARNDTCVLGGFLDLFTASNSRERNRARFLPCAPLWVGTTGQGRLSHRLPRERAVYSYTLHPGT